MLRSLGKFVGHCLVIAVFTLLLSECAIRLIGYSNMYFYDPIYMPFPESSQIPFVMKPNLHNARAHGGIWINTDSLGLRSLEAGAALPQKDRDEFRIAIMGDSVTFGYGVKTSETYACVLERMLNEKMSGCKVTVLNFGVSSYSIKEMAATLRYRTTAVSPDLVMAGIIFGDFNVARTPGIDREGYNTHGETSRILSEFPRLKSFLRSLHITYALRDVIEEMKAFGSAEQPASGLPSSYHYLVEMRDFSRARGIPFLVLTLPSLDADGSQFAIINETLRKDGIDHIDVSTIAKSFTPAEFKASRFDSHPSKYVHQRIAEVISSLISKTYIAPGRPRAQP